MADEQQAAQSNNNAAAPTETKVTQETPAKGEGQAAAAAPAPKKEGEAAAAAPTPAKKEGEPASPEVKLELPEGSKLTSEDVDRIASLAKDLGLSQDAASKLLQRESEMASSREELALSQLQEQSDAWKQEIVNDKEFGGERAAETAQLAHDFAKRFGDENFVSELERTGLGNHPGLVKMFARAGKAMASDVIRSGGTPAGAKKATTESKLYANTTPV